MVCGSAASAGSNHFAYRVLDDLRPRLLGLKLQFRGQIGFNAVGKGLRQLGKHGPDALGRFLDQHLRRIHGPARSNRSNQVCNAIVLVHRMLSELAAETFR